MANPKGRLQVLVRTFPLVIIDVIATIASFLIAAWGTKATEINLDSSLFIAQVAFFGDR